MESVRSKTSARSVVEGEVKNKTEFGLFLDLDRDIDGWPISPISIGNAPGVVDDFKKGAKGGRRCLMSRSKSSRKVVKK
jgi:small subunit ribosomal protein S1